MPTMPSWRRHIETLIENGGLYAGAGGMSALAKDLGVSRQTVYDWKAERNAPTRANRHKLGQLAGEPYA